MMKIVTQMNGVMKNKHNAVNHMSNSIANIILKTISFVVIVLIVYTARPHYIVSCMAVVLHTA